MKTSRGCRRVGTLCLVGLLVMVTVVSPSVGYAARLATEEAPATKKAAQRGAAPDGSQAGQRDGRGGTDGTIHLNFRNADILQIINLMSELTGKNFLVDDKIRGKVTIIAPKPVTLEEAYQVFLSVLEIQGFTVVPQGPIIKIIPSRDVKDNPIPTATDSQRPFSPTTDSFVTQLIPLQYADVNDIRGLLTPLVSKESSLLSYAPTNSLIVTDTVSNIARLLKIIAALDIEAPSAMFKVVMLKYAQAEQMANALRSAIEGLAVGTGPEAAGAPAEAAPQPGQPPAPRVRRPAQASTGQRTQRGARVIPDARTNSLVLIATRPDMTTIEDLITKIDIPTPEGRGQIHVYYLQYANAEELAQVLTAQAGEVARTLAGPTAEVQRPGVTPTTPGVVPPTTPPFGTQPRRQGLVAGTTPSGISIVADKATNSLVITAPPEAYALLKEIIQKLDVRRSQVLVESLIAEVTMNRAQNLGVEWRALNSPNGTQVFASSTGSPQTGLLNSTLGPLTGGTTGTTGAATALASLASHGFLLGLLNTLRIKDPNNPNNPTEVLNIPILLRAFQGDSDVNILATPNLLTTDNEEAEILIGENRPFLRSAQDAPVGGVTTGTSFSTIRSFEFKDVGITLRITPQISQGKTVRLKMAQEVTAFVSEAETGAPITSKRSAKTTVIVDDNQTIVIGGLIQSTDNAAKSTVPCLGNIPIFGWAFKQTSTTKLKTNLLIFLTPHIITSPEDIDRITTHERQRSDNAPAIEERLREGQPQDKLELLLN